MMQQQTLTTQSSYEQLAIINISLTTDQYYVTNL